jgi:hypothetical protein
MIKFPCALASRFEVIAETWVMLPTFCNLCMAAWRSFLRRYESPSLMVCIRIWEIPDSNFDQDAFCDQDLLYFIQYLQANAGMLP